MLLYPAQWPLLCTVFSFSCFQSCLSDCHLQCGEIGEGGSESFQKMLSNPLIALLNILIESFSSEHVRSVSSEIYSLIN